MFNCEGFFSDKMEIVTVWKTEKLNFPLSLKSKSVLRRGSTLLLKSNIVMDGDLGKTGLELDVRLERLSKTTKTLSQDIQ